MNKPATPLQQLIRQARSGDEKALGQLCERHRPYLRLLARRTLDSRIGARVDESDLVQQTLLAVVRGFKDFRGSSSAQLAAWVQVLYERTVVDTIRAHTAAKRAIGREGRVVGADEPADLRHDSPSARALRSEQAVLLAEAMETLPDDQREAVRLRHLEGWPLGKIAEALGRSEEAVAGLVKRGMARLRRRMREHTGG